MSPKEIAKIARMITESPDVFSEGWEELGLEDPFAGDDDEVLDPNDERQRHFRHQRI